MKPGSKIPGKKGKEEEDDDPIAKSLQERIAAGGVTQVVTKAGEKKIPSVSVPPPKKVKEKKEDSVTPRNKSTVKETVEKGVISKANKAGGNFGKKGGKDDDSDDPIA